MQATFSEVPRRSRDTFLAARDREHQQDGASGGERHDLRPQDLEAGPFLEDPADMTRK
jgi:hypothetical protein